MTPHEQWACLDVAAKLNNLLAAELREMRLEPEKEREVIRMMTRWWAMSGERDAREDGSNPVR